ncbi:MAG: peptidylprolyl isomerase [Candidatus Woesearchaeota archaeon]
MTKTNHTEEKSESISDLKLKVHDFVEIEYTGRLEDNTLFDTTDENLAKSSGLTRQGNFGPVVICLGENHILNSLDKAIQEKGISTFDIELEPENAFGKKNAQLLKLLPMKVFLKEKINPFPGLEVNVDNMYGVVRSVSGGRVIVDFNHPLAGKRVKYHIKVNKKIDEPLEKAKAVLKNEFNFLPEMKIENEILVIDEKIPDEVLNAIKERILKLIPEIKDVSKKHSEAHNEKAIETTSEKKNN